MGLEQVRKRYGGIQSMMRNIGDYGCLFLSLCSIIEEVTGSPADIIGIIQKSSANGWLADDFTVNDSLSLLGEFTGKSWRRAVVTSLPKAVAENEFTVEKWYNPRTRGNHFRRRFVDTLRDSQTVRTGSLESYYVYSYR